MVSDYEYLPVHVNSSKAVANVFEIQRGSEGKARRRSSKEHER